jgi:hypothetical protein
MKSNLTYYRDDIENWLYNNYHYFQPGNTSKEYAVNACRYHNSESCRRHCICYTENNQAITPRLSIEDKKWFKEVVADLIHRIWLSNTYIGIIMSTKGIFMGRQGDRVKSHFETYSRQ